MTTVFELNFYREIDGYLFEDVDDSIDRSGDYVSLADYQKLEALLKRWNEIAPDLKDMATDEEVIMQIEQTPELKQLIQDTSKVIK